MTIGSSQTAALCGKTNRSPGASDSRHTSLARKSARRDVCPRTWREAAAGIVEEIVSACDPTAWDDLLDLRAGLLRGEDWNATLDLFLACRERLEASHYLPFYRLRQLLGSSLQLEIRTDQGGACERSLEDVLRTRHRSLAHVARTFERERFEHDIQIAAAPSAHLNLRVVERAAFRQMTPAHVANVSSH